MKAQSILIVEDENIVALDMRMRLEAMGYKVVDIVDTGEQATESVTARKPDLVLMDIKLKGDQDGIEAASQLRETSEVPVIFVTAFTDERTLDRAKRVSPYGYIVKPFHERELRIAIELAIYKYQFELSIRRARDIAEESNRIKSEFLANMSHELKTPLNSVIGFSELALSLATDLEQREYLAMSLSSAKSLLTLINSILNFARMEAGKLFAVSTPFSLDEVIEECVDSLAIAAYSKGLDVSYRRDPSIPDNLIGDQSLLKHILLNLFDNAAKFTDKGSVRLNVSLLDEPRVQGRGPTIEFEITDSGIGIAKDKIELAFTRFTQLDPSRTRKAGGTGLGLAIVAKSVELMKGSINVDSEENRGTRLIVRIPFEVEDDVTQKGKVAENMGSMALLGFDDDSFNDAALVLSRLNIDARAAVDFSDAASASFVLVDERFLSRKGMEAERIMLLKLNLIIATRFGGSVRSEFSNLGAAFTPMPIRISGLRAAIGNLISHPRAEASDSRNIAQEAIGRPSDAREDSARGTERGVLQRLAEVIERSLTTGAFVEIEREARDARDILETAGGKVGSKLAFSALLSARKGDSKKLRDLSDKMRKI
jgi:signal transduction histidine kinase